MERLFEAEYRFAEIVWQNEPLGSGELVKLSADRLGWKKSTTYTMLKKLCDKGVLCNENALVTSVVKQEQVQHAESVAVMQHVFGGSLQRFVAAFLGNSKISEEQANELQRLIDSHRESNDEHTV